MNHASHLIEFGEIGWFVAALIALAVILAALLRVRLHGGGAKNGLARIGLTLVAVAVTMLANVALYKHDTHLDVTREKAFTPSPDALKVVRELREDIEVTYFYQRNNPAGFAAKTMLEALGRTNTKLKVRTVDPDQNPGTANRMGMKLYNAAVITGRGKRLEVISTDDRDVALGIVRILRDDNRPICFGAGQGEYNIDNFEFHTHFEGSGGHSHDGTETALVNVEQHGVGRVRRALEKLGYGVKQVELAKLGAVPVDCAAWIEANPRYRFAPPDVAKLDAYATGGGNLLFLIEPDYEVDAPLAALFAKLGVAVDQGLLVDPKSHYFTDEQMVAVSTYPAHPATINLGLTFFPGARPVRAQAVPGVTTTALLGTSAQSYSLNRLSGARSVASHYVLGITSQGRLPSSATGPSKPFRFALIGDADFASNSFFPYLGNADLTLGLIAWLRGEERGPAMKPVIEVLPTVALTNDQMRNIFLLTVLLLPGLVAALGVWMWWRRR